MKVKFKAFAQISVVALLAAACSSDPDSPGLEYMPDMYRSPAIEPYVDYAEVQGRTDETQKLKPSALMPPKYTIPYWGTDSETVHIMLPYLRKPGKTSNLTHGLYGYDRASSDDADYIASAADINPLKLKDAATAEKIFADGKYLYTINCKHCHGEKGDGQGPMVTSGAYTGAAVLTGLTIPEGQMFYSIYYGKNMMGAHNSLLNKKEIWTLVHYIRKFQDKNYGTFDAAGNPVVGMTATAKTDSIK